jgi:hypothetical protein
MKTTPYIPGQSGDTAVQQQVNLTKIVNSGIDVTYTQTRDTNNWPETFSAANIRGTMRRVSGTGITPPKGSVNWTAGNTKIPHNLGYIPSGWIVTYKSKACDIFAGTTKADAQFIYLTNTDPTADVNLLVF